MAHAGRGIVIAAAALMAAVLLAACSGSEAEPAVVSIPTPTPTVVPTPEVVETTPTPTPVSQPRELLAVFVNVSLEEFSIYVSEASVVAEEVYYSVANDGDEPHQLIVVSTNGSPGSLPVDSSTGQVVLSEIAGSTVEILGDGDTELFEIEPIAPGRYVLLCNLPGHYQRGEYTGFEVIAP